MVWMFPLFFSDVDLFSAINEKHGQLVGDQVLKVIAELMKKSLKGRDLVARYGGEEFAVILPHTSMQNARQLAESIRQDIASKRIQRKDTHEPPWCDHHVFWSCPLCFRGRGG